MTRSSLRLTILGFLALSVCLPGMAQTASEVDPSVNELRRGDEAYATHNYPLALRSYMNANRLENDACVKCYLGLSLTFVAMRNWRETAVMANKALEIATTNDDRAKAHNLRGTAFLAFSSQDASKLQLAEQEYRAASLADPSVPTYHFSLGVTLLKESSDLDAVKELRRFLELAPDDPKVAIVKQWVAEPRRARGEFAPDFRVTSLQGDEISLDSLKGKIVVLDFWATWCEPCRESLPDLKDLAKKYSQDRFVLLSISLDEDQTKWREFVSKEKMNWPQVYDGHGELFNLFGLQDVPTYIVLGADGSVIQGVVGLNPSQSIGNRLKDILTKQPELNSR
jgi:peroxiredoxin